MKTSTLILLIAILGMTSAAWSNAAEMCADKEGSAEDSAEDSGSAEKTMADASCEMLAMMNSKVKGYAAFDKSACDGAKSADIETMQKEIDDAISSTSCDVCTIYWLQLTQESERGMGSGCSSRKKMGKKGGMSGSGEGSDSASVEASAAERFLEEASASAEGSASGEGSGSGSMMGGKGKCRRGMGKGGMGGMGMDSENPDKEGTVQEKKPEMTDEELQAMEDKKNEMQKAMAPMMCAQIYMAMNGLGSAVGECVSQFEANAEFDAEAVDELMSDMYDTHKEKWDALGCTEITGQAFEAAATEAGIAAALSGFMSSQTYLFNFGMLIAVIMALFRY